MAITPKIDDRYDRDRPYRMGRDDGSEPVYVKAYGYTTGWRLGQTGWVYGTGLQAALDSHVLVRAVPGEETGTPPLQANGSQRPGETVPELGIVNAVGTTADSAALTEARSHRTTFDPALGTVGSSPAGVTYDLDAVAATPPTTKRRTRREALDARSAGTD